MSGHNSVALAPLSISFFQPCEFFPTVWSIWNSRVRAREMGGFVSSMLMTKSHELKINSLLEAVIKKQQTLPDPKTPHKIQFIIHVTGLCSMFIALHNSLKNISWLCRPFLAKRVSIKDLST